ncbi:MAG TPA: hypothetical protein VGF67_01940 [Ktedonobacteraceae bacterium]|jgi:hypothetical protein
MTQARSSENGPARITRTEQAASQVGERLGRLAGLTGLRIQQAARSLHTPTGRQDQPAERQDQAGRAATTARAEEAVDRLGQRISHWALLNGLRARRSVARLCEEAEDLWVEALEKRANWRGAHHNQP